jgi:hypothetical protein
LEASLRADDRGEAAATGRRPIVVVELAESFLLATRRAGRG